MEPIKSVHRNTTKRLLSLDALRGFDMFWITGGASLFVALANVTNSTILDWVALQNEHVEWDGFRFFDMIFPLFLFIAGVSMPFSFSKRMEQGMLKKQLYVIIVRRGLTLVFLGFIANGLLNLDFDNMRYAHVLGRIGLAWMFAAFIFINTSLKGQIIWFWGILLGYWAAMMLIPVPGFGAGNLTVEGSLVGYIDRLLLPGRLYLGVHDPEGILSTIPAISTALLGVFAGQLLISNSVRWNPSKKGLIILTSGIASLLIGYFWNLSFPINKNLWSSSFVFFAGGWSLLLLGVFYFVIDVWGYKKWAFYFVVIGMNPITIYLGTRFIDFNYTSSFFFNGLINIISEDLQPVTSALAYLATTWLFLYLLFRYKIFLKV